jgi:hypothetical protein
MINIEIARITVPEYACSLPEKAVSLIYSVVALILYPGKEVRL